jgi:exodeoxyribonuclease-5
LWFEDEITAGDYIMCVKNNYFWLNEKSNQGFIANGDILKITRVNRIEEKYGFRFADVSVLLPDEPGEPALEVKLVLDSLYTDAPALTKDQSSRLFHQVASAYSHIVQKQERQQAVARDSYFQALQVKFSYALTCHKAQGGQWKNVFVDQGYLTEEMIDTGYLRWLYTAVTRATENLYLVNFHDRFFESTD